MKVQKKSNKDLSKNLIEHILLSRGIPKDRVAHYLFPKKSMKPSYEGLENLEEAKELLHKHIQNQSKIYIQIDTDADGMTSASIMYQFLTKDLGVDEELVYYHIPQTKTHGISTDKVLEIQPNLVIAPDASSGEFDIHKKLHELGIDVLVLDHHLVDGDRYSEHAVVVNNQLSKSFKWKGLTGANIVLLFCEYYSDKLKLKINTDKYLDLATVGMIADRGSLLDESVFYYAQTGLKQINNPLLKLIISNNNNIKDDTDLVIKDVEYNIAPLINAVTRQAKDDDLQLVVDALFNRSYEVHNKRLKMDTSVVQEAFRRMNNARNRQNNKVKEAIEHLREHIKSKQSNENQVLFVNSTGVIEDSGINGLVAIKLAEEYKRPTLVMSLKGETFRGSGRNFNNSPVVDFKQVIEDSGMFEYALGHSGAFGVGITLDNVVEAIDVLNEQLEYIDYDLTYYVDLVYEGQPNAKEIQEIANHKHLWGQGIEEPTVFIHGVRINKNNIKLMGKNGNTLKINLGTCDSIKFQVTEDEKRALTSAESDMVEVNLVGKCGINSYKGMNAPQILITDFEIVELQNESPFDAIDEFNSTELPF